MKVYKFDMDIARNKAIDTLFSDLMPEFNFSNWEFEKVYHIKLLDFTRPELHKFWKGSAVAKFKGVFTKDNPSNIEINEQILFNFPIYSFTTAVNRYFKQNSMPNLSTYHPNKNTDNFDLILSGVRHSPLHFEILDCQVIKQSLKSD